MGDVNDVPTYDELDRENRRLKQVLEAIILNTPDPVNNPPDDIWVWKLHVIGYIARLALGQLDKGEI